MALGNASFSVSNAVRGKNNRIDPLQGLTSDNKHPLVVIENFYGITCVEAARRLGISVRQYSRYKAGDTIPNKICVLVELGALEKNYLLDKTKLKSKIEEWNIINNAG